MKNYSQKASRDQVQCAVTALKANGIEAVIADTAEAAKTKVLSLIPKGAQIFTMTSMTLDALGISKIINESGEYDAVRPKLANPALSPDEKRKLGAAPDWTVGSVHAATSDGALIIASNTGSQLPAYVYGAGHVIWVVGTQKVVKDIAEGMERISTYTLPLESERARKAYGVPGSSINKLLIIKKEVQPGRATVVFVDEAVGF